MKRGWDVDDLVDDVDVDVDVDEGRLTGSPVWWGGDLYERRSSCSCLEDKG